MASRDFDVLIATDFRRSGDATESVRQEIECQALMGLRTGLVHVESSRFAGRPWDARIRAAVVAGLAQVISPDQPASAHVLLLRNPAVFASERWSLAARGDRTSIIADELRGYTASAVAERVSAELGVEPSWAPVSAIVRDALGSSVPMAETDWHDVIELDAWCSDRPKPRCGPRVIGRHVIDASAQWPDSRRDVLAAYPSSSKYDVRILGGCDSVKDLVSPHWRRWTVYPHPSLSPPLFLADLDAFVYFHRASHREPSARAILEAIAAGTPVVTHRYIEKLFGDACHYGTPRGARRIVDRLARGEHAEVAQRLRERHDWSAHSERIERLVGAAPKPPRRGRRKQRVLMMSSNGGGLGHLTRLLGIARRMPDNYEVLFLSLSKGVEASRAQGFWSDYAPGPRSSELRDRAWAAYLNCRVASALRTLRPDAFVFDGTFVYRGLTDALAWFPHVHKTWCRRAMWKPVDALRAARALAHVESFDLVLEPGEYARERDHGVTGSQRHLSRQVAPMALLDNSELMLRAEAREHIGIPSDCTAVLLNLGAGNINNIENVIAPVTEILRDRPDVQVVAMQSLIANTELSQLTDGVTVLQMYPLARVLRAFDFCVAAPGYNSFHELLGAAVPTLFVPNELTALDDQTARARWADDAGVSLCVRAEEAAEIRDALHKLLDAGVRSAMGDKLGALPAPTGATEAASLIANRERSVDRRSQGRGETAGPNLRALLAEVRRAATRRVVGLVRRYYPTAAPPPPTAHGPLLGDRVLLVVPEDQSADDAQALVDKYTRRRRAPVVWTRTTSITPFGQLGVSAELLPDQIFDPSTDTIDFADYTDEKLVAALSAYHIGEIICTGDAPISARLAALVDERAG